MSHVEAWLVLSFGIMVVAALATLYEKVDRLARRLDRLDGAHPPEADDCVEAVAHSDAAGRADRRI